MEQAIIDRAVNIATKAALMGNPVERVIYIPPQTATQDSFGGFCIRYAGSVSATETPPWEDS